jgi:hypothetical protein
MEATTVSTAARENAGKDRELCSSEERTALAAVKEDSDFYRALLGWDPYL